MLGSAADAEDVLQETCRCAGEPGAARACSRALGEGRGYRREAQYVLRTGQVGEGDEYRRHAAVGQQPVAADVGIAAAQTSSGRVVTDLEVATVTDTSVILTWFTGSATETDQYGFPAPVQSGGQQAQQAKQGLSLRQFRWKIWALRNSGVRIRTLNYRVARIFRAVWARRGTGVTNVAQASPGVKE